MEEEESSPSVAGDEVKEERPAVNPAALPEPSRRGLAAALLNVARGRWKRVKDLVSATKRAARLALLDKQDFQRENEQALGQAARGQLDVALVVGRQQDLTAINYARQGDASMYTSDVMAARHHNRTDGRLVEAIRCWWRWLPKEDVEVREGEDEEGEGEGQQTQGGAGGSGQQQRKGGGLGEGGAGAEARVESGDKVQVVSNVLSRAIYSAMVVAISMVLLPRFGLKADPNYDPTEDWLDDNKGLPYMEFPNFFDALFELVDMWASSVDVDEYVELINSLLLGVQQDEARNGTFTRLLIKFGYKPPPRPTTSPSPQPLLSSPARPRASSPPPNIPRLSFPTPAQPPSHAPTPPPQPQEVAQHSTSTPAPLPIEPLIPPPGSGSSSSKRVVVHAPLVLNAAPRVATGTRDYQPRPTSFKVPKHDKVDVSGVRSTLGDYVRSAPPRADEATQRQWRDQRSARRLAGGAAGAAVTQRSPLPLSTAALSARHLDAELGEAGPDGVRAYEEYMHDMAARYLAAQEEVLVTTSASAAVAAGQVLSAAGWAPAAAAAASAADPHPPTPSPPPGQDEEAQQPGSPLNAWAGPTAPAAAHPRSSTQLRQLQLPDGSAHSTPVNSAPTTPIASSAAAAAAPPSPSAAAARTPASPLQHQLHSYLQPVGIVGQAVGSPRPSQPGAAAASNSQPPTPSSKAPTGSPSRLAAREVNTPTATPAGPPSSSVAQPPAAGPTPHMTPRTQTNVMMAFAQAAYKLADPHVHALLLPNRPASARPLGRPGSAAPLSPSAAGRCRQLSAYGGARQAHCLGPAAAAVVGMLRPDSPAAANAVQTYILDQDPGAPRRPSSPVGNLGAPAATTTAAAAAASTARTTYWRSAAPTLPLYVSQTTARTGDRKATARPASAFALPRPLSPTVADATTVPAASTPGPYYCSPASAPPSIASRSPSTCRPGASTSASGHGQPGPWHNGPVVPTASTANHPTVSSSGTGGAVGSRPASRIGRFVSLSTAPEAACASTAPAPGTAAPPTPTGVAGGRTAAPADVVAPGAGGVLLPHGNMPGKLRTFYTSSPSSLVTPAGSMAGHVLMTHGSGSAPGPGFGATMYGTAEVDSWADEPVSPEGKARGAVQWAGLPPESPAPQSPGSRERERERAFSAHSPIRIRSSEPVGFSDAITAARINVSLMTEELTYRQREKRAAAKSQLQRAMLLRPTTAEKRQAYHNSFAAFLAAKEAAAAAVGVAAGAGPGAALEAAAFVEAG